MKALAVFGAIVGVVIWMVFSSVVNGYVLSVLWGWFVVPTFNSAPELGIAPAIGIAMVVGYMTHQIHDCKKEERSISEEIWRGVGVTTLRPLLALFFGSVIHLFM